MKPIPVFEMDLWHAKNRVMSALQDLFDHKDDPDTDFNEYQELSWKLDNALGWIKSVENYYEMNVTGRTNDETDGH